MNQAMRARAQADQRAIDKANKPPFEMWIVVSVQTGTATIKPDADGASVPGVPYCAHVTGLAAGQNVLVARVGDTRSIVGRY